VVGAIACVTVVGCAAFVAINAAAELASGASLGQVLTGIAVGYVTGGIARGIGQTISGAIGLTSTIGRGAAEAIGRGVAGGLAAEAQGGSFKRGFLGSLQGFAIARATAAVVSGVSAGARSQERGTAARGSGDSEGAADPETARKNADVAKRDIIRQLRRAYNPTSDNPIYPGYNEDFIIDEGGYDSIEINVVPEEIRDGSGRLLAGRVDYGFIRDPITSAATAVTKVRITVTLAGAATLAQAYATLAHELRHLSPRNQEIGFQGGDREPDAEAYGERVQRFFQSQPGFALP
jgi:hypothetical protein